MKGQLFSIDFIVALMIFTGLMLFMFFYWTNVPKTAQLDLQNRAYSLSNFIVTQSFGKENVLECSKLFNLAFRNYTQLKSDLNINPYDFYIELFSLSANTCPAIRPKLDIMLVMDRSGSMNDDNKMDDAKTAANSFVGSTNAAYDQAGLVSFSTTASLDQTLLNMTASNKTALKSVIGNLTANGWTDIGDGIGNATMEFLSNRSRGDSTKVQVLLSDGNPNRPVNTATALKHSIDKAREACSYGIKIYTISLGGDANRTLMQDIANITGGKEYYAPAGNDLLNIFSNISQDITVVSAYGTKPPSTVPDISSVSRIVQIGTQTLQMNVKVYGPIQVGC
ncbi:MAG TPA: vWA domain-containing protein [archaeon]|nr:vWA domain-containing protein [archaeon]